MPYKIVKEINGRFFSMSGITRWGNIKVEYIPLVWTFPRLGKLFFFEDLSSACASLQDVQVADSRNGGVDNQYQLWEVQVRNPAYRGKILRLDKIAIVSIFQRIEKEPDEFQRYWYGAKEIETVLVYPPVGTKVCDAIKLIKQI